jgi:hypothetical protein
MSSSILSTIFILTANAFGEFESSTAPMQSQRVVITIISESMRAWTWASLLGAFVGEGMDNGVLVDFEEQVRLHVNVLKGRFYAVSTPPICGGSSVSGQDGLQFANRIGG